jgi:hypothetical protein
MGFSLWDLALERDEIYAVETSRPSLRSDRTT